MKFITKIKISGFRSIREDTIKDIEGFTTLAGLNNSGKSNYIRALNLFFNGEVEPNFNFYFNRDYYRADIRRKRSKKKIKIEVHFCIPDNFKFRKGLEEVKNLLMPNGNNEFSITKEWTKDQPYPNIYLNNQDSPLNQDDRTKTEQFLSLISFRYIPNRSLPIEIIKREHHNLRDVLIRRVSKKKPKGSEEVFEEIAETSKRLIKDLHKDLKNITPDFEDIRLDTPTSFSDMIFAFGYKLKEYGFEIEDMMQGSGIQSLLMFNTLYLIDKDYFQKFGWKQAAIWGIEEPESSLHFGLEAQLGNFLSKITTEQNSRLQVIATTHSELIIQYSDRCYHIKKTDRGSQSETGDISEMLYKFSKVGVTGWQHPILKNPLKPLILVEGKRDVEFLKKVSEFPAYKTLNKAQICCLEDITLASPARNVTGGVDELVKYIKDNVKVIKNRSDKYPIIVLLDWDAKNKEQEIKKYFQENDPIKVIIWNERDANPKLGKDFKGLERFMSDRIIKEIKEEKLVGTIGFPPEEKYTLPNENRDGFKTRVAKIIQTDLKEKDLDFAKKTLQKLIESVKDNL